MPGMIRTLAVVSLGLALAAPAYCADPERDFSGHWTLDARASSTRALGMAPEAELTVTQQDAAILISTPSREARPIEWSYSLPDASSAQRMGAESRYKIGAESRNSVAKWEGAALLVNTLVSGPESYTVMDRWRLSRDRQTLTIVRQIVRRSGQAEGTLIYTRAVDGVRTAAPAAAKATSAHAIDPERDFSGRWMLDARASSTRALGMAPETELTVTQQDVVILISTPSGEAKPTEWFYSLTGADARYKIGAESRSSIAKWEGAALLVKTLVSGTPGYTVMDRWRLSRDRQALTIVRQIVRKTGQVEGTLVYNRAVEATPLTEATPVMEERPPEVKPLESARPVESAPKEMRPAEPAEPPAEFVVPSGTRLALSLRNSVDTKHSHEGDHIYLRTEMPVTVNSRIVIPEGSFVNGTLTLSKPAGKVKGKGELFIRFDSLILPNGVTRDFHSRLASADSTARGQVDSEGKVTGEGDPNKARNVALGGATGAGVGGLAGRAAGHTLGGLGVGAVAGGIAGVLLSKRADVVLPRGTTLEMILDRDLTYSLDELRRPTRF